MNCEPGSSVLESGSRITQEGYRPTQADIDRIMLESVHEGDARIICDDQNIHFVNGSAYHPELAQEFASGKSAPVAIFFVDMACDVDHQESEANPESHSDRLFPQCATPKGSNGFAEFIRSFNTHALQHTSQSIVVVITMSALRGSQGTLLYNGDCMRRNISRIREMSKGRDLYMHYAPSIEDASSSEATSCFIEFLFDSVKDAISHRAPSMGTRGWKSRSDQPPRDQSNRPNRPPKPRSVTEMDWLFPHA